MQQEKVKSNPEDFDLLEQFNSGNDTAFTRIVEKHSGPLINFLYRYTQNKNVSEDIAQEAFLRLYKAAHDLKPGAKLSTILYKIACNLAIDHARKNKSQPAKFSIHSLDSGRDGGLPQNDPPADPATNPDAVYEINQRDAEIAARLAELPDTQRIAIIFKVYEDRAYAEIAEIMDLSVSSVESLLFRARQSLAKKLK